MPHCVMVAQQILVLYVWVRILVGQQELLIIYICFPTFIETFGVL